MVSGNICIIPARMASGRFPGKPLEPLLGLPLVIHVLERCRLCPRLDRVVVATCDEEIRSVVEDHGGEAVMTLPTHPGCVDRTAEAVAELGGGLADDDLVLMVQGDEVLVSPDMAAKVIQTYEDTRVEVVNLASPITETQDHDDPNVVKVVATQDGRALYFSRAPIPSRARTDLPIMLQQTGVIGFSKSFLYEFGRLERTPLEIIEHIDMMRTLEHGYSVRIVIADRQTIGVDTSDDLARAEKVLRTDPWTTRYMDMPA